MAQTTLYLDPSEAQDRFGLENMLAVFAADGANGVRREINQQAVYTVILAASRKVTSAVATNYRGTLPFPANQIPDMAVELTYQEFLIGCVGRAPDWGSAWLSAQKITLNDLYKLAAQTRKELHDAVLRMPDAQAPTPANVGGIVHSNVGSANYPGPPPLNFADLGDF